MFSQCSLCRILSYGSCNFHLKLQDAGASHHKQKSIVDLGLFNVYLVYVFCFTSVFRKARVKVKYKYRQVATNT